MQSSHLAVKLDMDFGFKAEQVGACVEVKWNSVQAGACYVKYEVVFRNASRGVINSQSGYNIGEKTICNLSSNSTITYVDLTVSFKTASKNFTANVAEAPVSTPAPATPGIRLLCCFSLALFKPFLSLYNSRYVLNVVN